MKIKKIYNKDSNLSGVELDLEAWERIQKDLNELRRIKKNELRHRNLDIAG